MKFSLRPTSISDLNAVREFLQRVFKLNRDAPFLDPALMAWKYWDRRDDWEGPRAYVLERAGVIVAHAGIYPVVFGAGAVRGVQIIDWASAKESPGSGVALLRYLDSMFDFVYSIGGSEMTRKILPAFGFVEYARQWKGARPIRPLQQILTHQYRNWKLAPRLVRNMRWALPRAAEGCLHAGWKSEEVAPSDIPEDLYFQGMADAVFSPRPPAFFEFLLRCPVMRIRLYGIHDGRERKGHFALGMLHGQARVAGVWLLNPDPETWQTAFCLAQQESARLEGANEIVAAGSEGLSELGATRSGIRITGRNPVYLLNRKGRLVLPPNFQFQLSDDDALFLNSGAASYWT